jgi:hypothetical protein
MYMLKPDDFVGDSHLLSPTPKDSHLVCVPVRLGYPGGHPLSPGRLGMTASRVVDSLWHPKVKTGQKHRLIKRTVSQLPNGHAGASIYASRWFVWVWYQPMMEPGSARCEPDEKSGQDGGDYHIESGQYERR